MKLGHIELFAGDVARSKDFYSRVLGFTVTVDMSPELVWLEKDGQEFLLRAGPRRASAHRYEEAAFGIVLYTTGLAETRQQLEALGLVFRGTIDTDKCLTFTDPDGNWFQLVDPEDIS